MANERLRGLGLLGKIILFSVVPSFLITGSLVYLYDRDLKDAITQKYIEEALTAATAIQNSISPTDLLNRPSDVVPFLKAIMRINPNFLKISVYAEKNGKAVVIASTDPNRVGQPADSDDIMPLKTGRALSTEHSDILETISPYLSDGRPLATIGVYTSTGPREALVAHLTQRIPWFALAGSALILVAVFFVVYRVMLAPVRLLSKGSETIAQGRLDHRVPVKSRDEIGYLTESFNTMASSLQSLMDQETEKTRRLSILHESAIHIATEENLDALMNRLVEYPRHLLKSEVSSLYLLDSRGGEIAHFKHAGVDLNRYPIKELPKGTGLLGVFLRDRTPVRVENIRLHPASRGLPPNHFPIKNFLGVPLLLRDRVIGGMAVANKIDGSAYTQEDEDLLMTLAFQAASAIERMQLFEESQKQAITDGLTGLFNHREFQKRLTEELERSKRYNREFSLLMIDIDFFKSFNDTYGHPIGDQVLSEIGSRIKQTLRTMDIPARYGGEEFAIIAPETTAENGKILADRLRKNVADHPFLVLQGERAVLSVSIGVASYPLDAQNREDLIRAADQALYFAKEAGRNCAYLYSESLKSTIEKKDAKITELLLDPELSAIKDLAMAIDAKSPYTRGHTKEVTTFVVRMADFLRLDEVKKESLRVASLLHNIGIVSVPDRIINKAGPLNLEERKIIQAHPMLAEMILKKAVCSPDVAQAILYHHERFDGNGYPNGLQGEEIPYLARILSVVEAYHAMISIRPYRRRLTPEEAAEELRRNAGTQFDPAIVEAFLRMLKTSP
jgi:diguanylate cyclase (GGDEF)-like protein